MLFSPTEPFVSDDSLRLAQRLQFGPDRRLHLGAVAHEAPQGLDPALARSALPLVTFQGHWTVRATLPWFESETQTVGDGPCLVLRLLSNAAWPGTQGAENPPSYLWPVPFRALEGGEALQSTFDVPWLIAVINHRLRLLPEFLVFRTKPELLEVALLKRCMAPMTVPVFSRYCNLLLGCGNVCVPLHAIEPN